jgi:imidazolonepropionase-like amidohydrolase
MRSLVLTLLLCSSLHAQPSRTALSSEAFAITNVTVIPMTSEQTLPNQTVLVKNGRIAAMGDKTDLPAGIKP